MTISSKRITSSITKKISESEKNKHFYALVLNEEGKAFIVSFLSPHHCQIRDFDTLDIIQEKMVSDLPYLIASQCDNYLENHDIEETFESAIKRSKSRKLFLLRKSALELFLGTEEKI